METEIFRCNMVFADRFCVKVNPVNPDTTAKTEIVQPACGHVNKTNNPCVIL